MNLTDISLQQEVYNHLPCGCVTVDAAGLITNANDTFIEYSGFEKEDIINNYTIYDFLSPTGKEYVDKNLKPLLDLYGHIKGINLDLICQNGNQLTCLVNSVAVKDGFSKTVLYHHTFLDISENIKFKRALLSEKRRADICTRKLDKLVAEITHITSTIAQEVQSPLRNILGLIGLLKKNYTNSYNQTGHQFLDFIGESGEKMRHQLADLLNMFPVGKGATDKEFIDLNKVLAETEKNLAQLIKLHHVTISVPNKLPVIFGINADIVILFQNLLRNAIQFKKINSSPNIEITFVEAELLYHFKISDNGTGIEEQYHDKIFEEYFHVDPKGDDCAGKGLSECKSIVENHKGSIGVISSPGNGCAIIFSLEK